YRLYSAVTTGRRGAGRGLKELEDVICSLRCAVDHLGQVANDISATASKNHDSNSIEMRQKLNLMIDSCASTLQELDSVTQKYRDGVRPAEGDVVGDDIVPLDRAKKSSVARVKRNLEINWIKIRWETERQTLSEYRY